MMSNSALRSYVKKVEITKKVIASKLNFCETNSNFEIFCEQTLKKVTFTFEKYPKNFNYIFGHKNHNSVFVKTDFMIFEKCVLLRHCVPHLQAL